MTTYSFCISEQNGSYRLRITKMKGFYRLLEHDSPHTTEHDTFGAARQLPEELFGDFLDWEYSEQDGKNWYAAFNSPE